LIKNIFYKNYHILLIAEMQGFVEAVVFIWQQVPQDLLAEISNCI